MKPIKNIDIYADIYGINKAAIHQIMVSGDKKTMMIAEIQDQVCILFIFNITEDCYSEDPKWTLVKTISFTVNSLNPTFELNYDGKKLFIAEPLDNAIQVLGLSIDLNKYSYCNSFANITIPDNFTNQSTKISLTISPDDTYLVVGNSNYSFKTISNKGCFYVLKYCPENKDYILFSTVINDVASVNYFGSNVKWCNDGFIVSEIINGIKINDSYNVIKLTRHEVKNTYTILSADELIITLPKDIKIDKISNMLIAGDEVIISIETFIKGRLYNYLFSVCLDDFKLSEKYIEYKDILVSKDKKVQMAVEDTNTIITNNYFKSKHIIDLLESKSLIKTTFTLSDSISFMDKDELVMDVIDKLHLSLKDIFIDEIECLLVSEDEAIFLIPVKNKNNVVFYKGKVTDNINVTVDTIIVNATSNLNYSVYNNRKEYFIVIQ